MVTILGWEAGKGAGAIGSRDETRGVRVPAGAKSGVGIKGQTKIWNR